MRVWGDARTVVTRQSLLAAHATTRSAEAFRAGDFDLGQSRSFSAACVSRVKSTLAWMFTACCLCSSSRARIFSLKPPALVAVLEMPALVPGLRAGAMTGDPYTRRGVVRA